MLGASLLISSANAQLDDVDVAQVATALRELRVLGWAPEEPATAPVVAEPQSTYTAVNARELVLEARKRGFIEDHRDKGGALWVHGLPKGVRMEGWSWTDHPHSTCGRPGYFSKTKGKVLDALLPLVEGAARMRGSTQSLFEE